MKRKIIGMEAVKTKLIKPMSVIALAVSVFLANIALAQENPTPSKSIESFQAWTVECNNIQVQAKAPGADAATSGETGSDEKKFRRICEAIQTYTNQKTGNEVARLAFAVDDKDKGNLVGGLRTLVDVSFDSSPAVMVGEEELFKGKFSRCAGIYCFVLFEKVTDKNIAVLEKAEKAVVQYPIARGRMLRINISTKGLSDSLKALKAKAE